MKPYIRIYTAIIFSLCFTLSGLAQRDIPKDDKTYTMEISSRDYTENITVARNNPNKGKPCKHLWYYWYLNNAVHFSEGGYSGKLLNGQYTSFYKNMNLRSSGVFRYGLMDKEWKTWYENGVLKSTEHWKKGVKHGTCIYFSEDNKSRTVKEYRRGILNGKQKLYCNDSLVDVQKFRNGKEIIKKNKIKADSSKDSLVEKNVQKSDQKNKLENPENNYKKRKEEKTHKSAKDDATKEKTVIRIWPFKSKKETE
jgi:hypothetical protein